MRAALWARLLCVPVGGGFLLLMLVAPRVFRAPEGPAAREARRPHFVRRRASNSARALRSLRRPPHQWGLVAVWSLTPGPAAHRHRSQALRSLRRPSHQWGLVANRRLGASARSPARPCHRPPARRPGPPDPQCGLACRAGILGLSAVCCYKRRQSEVFFVWISDPLLQTSSIRWLFR